MKISLKETIARLLPDGERFLCDLIRFPSTPGLEKEAMAYAAAEFEKLGLSVEKIPLSNAVKSDSDYADPIPNIQYDGRYNLRITRKGERRRQATPFQFTHGRGSTFGGND